MMDDWFKCESYNPKPPDSEPPESSNPKEKGVNIWVTIVVWAVSLLISAGIPFLLFIFDADEQKINIDLWYVVQKSTLLRDLGLVLFVEITAYLIILYKQKNLKLDIKDSQFILNIFSLLLAICDIFLCEKYVDAEVDSIFKMALWVALVICSCVICISGQIEVPQKRS